MMSVQEFEAKIVADYYQQKANEAAHEAAFIAQSTYGHTPPPSADNPQPSAKLPVKAAVRASLGLSQQPQTELYPGLARIKAKAAHQQAQAQQAEFNRLVSEVRGAIANVQNAVNVGVAVARADVARADVTGTQPEVVVNRGGFVQTQGVIPTGPTPKMSIRDVCRRSVGL